VQYGCNSDHFTTAKGTPALFFHAPSKFRSCFGAMASPYLIAALCVGVGILAFADVMIPGESLWAQTFIIAGLLAILAIDVTRSADRSQMDALRRQKQVAETANAAKSRYLASVSHEIRSPLNAIYGYAQLLERNSAVNPLDAARVIRRSAEHLNDLVEGLLDISLVENGIMRVASDTVRLGPFIDQVVSMFRPAAAAKGLEFRLETEGRLPDCVRTDQKRLRQVLINLLSNAVKYTGSGSVTLHVRYAGEVAVFEVRDTGPGIAADAQEAIFAPFDRGVATGTSGGVGLGLPISRAMVHILGGQLELDSSPGEGSCFRVRLHLPYVPGQREAEATPGRIVGYEGARRSVMVMDDDASQLAFVRSALKALGFDVAAAPDGDTALALCASGAFDLALLDVTVPGRNGWEVAEQLRATQGDGLRIVMLSANAHERHGPEGIAPSHDLFLVKPVEIDALVQAIGSQLDLTWALEHSVDRHKPVQDTHLPDAAQPHIERLQQHLKLGHVRGIEAEIRELASAAPEAESLIADLYACLDRFDLAGLGRRLDGI
jgi:signal transduction histidine kinase/DNA-binding NarL/FixJ family response regulator